MLAFILLVPSVAVATIWAVALVRLGRAERVVPSLRRSIPADGAPVQAERVCVVVPAHNEEACIAGVVASLRAQRGVELRVVLALDRCTDATLARAREAIADDPRFEIIQIDHCPEGWAGKVHSIWTAVERSASIAWADLLLFLDADLTMDPDCIRAAMSVRLSRNLDLVTLLPMLRGRYWFERIVQPACVVELAYEFPLERANLRQGRRAFVNGQFILIRREAYERVGGHRALRDEIMEDFGLARLTVEHDLGVGVVPAGDMLRVSMHESWGAFVKGWTRIFVAGARQRVRRLERWALRIWFLAAGLPVLCAIVLAMSLWGWGWLAGAGVEPVGPARWIVGGAAALALIVLHIAIAAVYWRQRAPLWAVLVFVPAAVVVGCIMWNSARTLAARRPIPWGGRAYIFEPR